MAKVPLRNFVKCGARAIPLYCGTAL